MVSRRTDIGIGLALVVWALLSGGPGASAADAGCGSKALYVAAHQDDTLIFQSPDLLAEVRRGRCVRTVFTTAGDPALGESYWRSRDAGAEAAYAEMAGVPDEWTETEIVAGGHSLPVVTLDGAPRISIVFMRLPDGAPDGKGYALYDQESLVKLWRGGNPGHGGPTIGEITSVDGASTYTYRGLVETLEQLITSYAPDRIATENFAEPLFEGDHPDHTATAYFVKLAAESYPQAHRLIAYQGYQDAERPAEVGGAPLADKTAAFYAYGAHDSKACWDELSCSGTIYPIWLKRQYVTANLVSGVLADAGDSQNAMQAQPVTLDGTGSGAEGELRSTTNGRRPKAPASRSTAPTRPNRASSPRTTRRSWPSRLSSAAARWRASPTP